MEPLKDSIYNEQFYIELTKALKKNYKKFNEPAFRKFVYAKDWKSLELKQRMRRYTEALSKFVELPFAQAIDLFKKVIPEISDKFATLTFPEYVELNGLDDYDIAMDALEFFTPYGSSELSIRPFIIKYPKKTMARMKKWARSSDEHVRRLASEGCRPRLPWAMALPDFKKDPAPVLAVLQILKKDKSAYVRKSVANNLNDIAKDNPETVVKIAKEWSGRHKDTDWIVKHACRTLLKQGHPEVMALFGFDPSAVKVTGLKFAPLKVKIGKDAEFSFKVGKTVAETVKLRLEYGIDFVKKNGKTSRKIFQISESDFTEKNRTVTKKHSFKDLSTRTHLPGEHAIVVIANGKATKPVTFQVIK